MLRIFQQQQNSVSLYIVARPFVIISIVGAFSLLYLATMLSISQTTAQAHQHSSPVIGMIERVFGPHAAGAIHVARCESGLNTGAYNFISIRGNHSMGVFQILYPSTWRGTSQAGSSPYNAWANILAAHEIFVRDGYSWKAWVCKP